MRPKSLKPKKQRKYVFNAPKNEVHKMMSSTLSKLRASKGFRSLPVKVGDTVLVMRGAFKGREQKVVRVEPSKFRVYLEKITRGKTDKTEIPIAIHPSNLMITKFSIKQKRKNDTFRARLVNRRVTEEKLKVDFDDEEFLEDEIEEDVVLEDEEVELVEDEIIEEEEDEN